jgi:hypothetical protein
MKGSAVWICCGMALLGSGFGTGVAIAEPTVEVWR